MKLTNAFTIVNMSVQQNVFDVVIAALNGSHLRADLRF